MRPYGIEMRERVMRGRDAGELQQDLAERFEVSVRWIQKLAKLRRETGSQAPKPATGGRKPIVSGEIEERLKAQVAKQRDATLSELKEASQIARSLYNVHRALRRLKITRKKTLIAAEQPRPDIVAERGEWAKKVTGIDPSRMWLLDEANARTMMTRLHGRAARGTRVKDYVPDGHWSLATMLAAIHWDGSGPCLTDSGGTDVPTIQTFVKQLLIPELGLDDVVVMDNHNSH